jgi:hypothetical protein
MSAKMMGVLLCGLGSIALSTLLLDLVCYVALTPALDQPVTPHAQLSKYLSRIIYTISYALGVLRVPYAVLPYLGKCLVFLLLREHFWVFWHRPSSQILRLGGDFANLVLSSLLIMPLLGDAVPGVVALFYAAFFAESVRIIGEKLQTVVSGLWQLLPHQSIATIVRNVRIPMVHHYAIYYALPPDERARALLSVLKQSICANDEAALKLNYLRCFRIVPSSIPLRTGTVRDIPLGEIYIHPAWTNDPWLLIGQALRRSPWIFDPRYVERPLFYRTHTNRLSTLFVLDFALCSPPYAIYQFGHEIKVARYDAFFRVMKWLGFQLEAPLRADGTFRGDMMLRYIERLLRDLQDTEDEPMLTLAQTRREINASLRQGDALSPIEVARRYAYPLCYVEEVLLPELYAENAARTASATACGASQCG